MVSAALSLPTSSSSWEFIASSPLPAPRSSISLDAAARVERGGPEIKAKQSLKRPRGPIGDRRWSIGHFDVVSIFLRILEKVQNKLSQHKIVINQHKIVNFFTKFAFYII